MSENVYIAGIDMIQFGRYPDKTVPSLGAEAAKLALKDAGEYLDAGEGDGCQGARGVFNAAIHLAVGVDKPRRQHHAAGNRVAIDRRHRGHRGAIKPAEQAIEQVAHGPLVGAPEG